MVRQTTSCNAHFVLRYRYDLRGAGFDMADASEREVFVAEWSRGPTVVGIVIFGGIAGIIAVSLMMSGLIVSGLCGLAIVYALSKLSLMSARAKYVAITKTNLEIGKGIWADEIVTVPLEKIDKITVNSGAVRVSAGTLLNQVNLAVQNPKLLAERLEKARSEIGQTSRLPSANDKTLATPPPEKAVAGAKPIMPTKVQVTATWLVIGVIVATILGFSRCSLETRQSACSAYTGNRQLICEQLASECLKGNNMTREPGCRAAFPNGY